MKLSSLTFFWGPWWNFKHLMHLKVNWFITTTFSVTHKGPWFTADLFFDSMTGRAQDLSFKSKQRRCESHAQRQPPVLLFKANRRLSLCNVQQMRINHSQTYIYIYTVLPFCDLASFRCCRDSSSRGANLRPNISTSRWWRLTNWLSVLL